MQRSEKENEEYRDNSQETSKKQNRDIQPESEKTFAELFNVETDKYRGVPIDRLFLSRRVNNRLNFIGVETIGDLLRYSPASLMKIDHFGVTSLNEIIRYLEQQTKDNYQIKIPVDIRQNTSPKMIVSSATKEFIVNHIAELEKGEYQSLIDESGENTEQNDLLQYLMTHHDEIDYPLLLLKLQKPEQAEELYKLLKRIKNFLSYQVLIREALDLLPFYKRKNSAAYYISAYERNELEKDALSHIYDSNHIKLEDALWNDAVNEDNISILLRFLKWCKYDLNKEICDALTAILNKKRYEDVIRIRTEGSTLQETGLKLGLSRERIRQIQTKIINCFERWQRKDRFMMKIFADRNGDAVLTEKEIAGFCGAKTSLVIFLLKESTCKDYKYSKNLNLFIIESDGTEEGRVRNFVDSLPDFFDQAQLNLLLSEATKENDDIPLELFETQIISVYKKEAEFYYRSKMRRQQMFEAILQKYYPEGIHIYNPDELAGFKRHFFEDFGGDLPNDRSLVPRLADAGILCARGTYKPRQKEYISADLAEQIADFIDTNKSDVLPIHYVYRRFQIQLNNCGVNNHYYLQGILHELFDGRFFITRDYVSKTEKAFSAQSLIQNYICSSQKPVTYDDILAHIPGVSQIVISMASNIPDILKYYGSYMFAGNITIDEKDKTKINQYISSKIEADVHCNNREIYAWLQEHCSQFLRDNYIRDQFSCFSVLEYIFNNSFQFARPFIGTLGDTILRPYELLKDYLRDSEEIDIKEFASYLRDNGINTRSTLSTINENNDMVFIYSNKKLIALHLLDINEQIAKKVEEIVLPYVNSTMAIRDLPCFTQLPAINVAWTDWLIYSTLRKWSKKLDVGETTSRIDYAVPLIAPYGMMDENAISVDARQQESFEADNLENLDDLIEDMIEWEDLEND